ncbi:MAG: hypothetical protein HYT07_03950 [Candidatus Levybacteria bacterium]|nr:hypothetical protein [Candidatus Levybacteria bacterium]
MLQAVQSSKCKVQSWESGQVLLIVILVIIVSLTIGLSIAGRSITNIRTSTEEAESQKALAAAEAGIERALQDTQVGLSSGSLSPLTGYDTNVVEVGTGANLLLVNGGSLIPQSEGVDIWLANQDPTNDEIEFSVPGATLDLTLHWGVAGEICADDSNPSNWPAAIEVIVIRGTSSLNVSSTRSVFDPCNTHRGNGFSPASTSPTPIGGKTLQFETTNLNITEGIFVRAIPVYKSTFIGAEVGGATFPSQGYQITSTGESGEASRRISVFKGFSQAFLPYISYGLFVPSN